MRAEQAVDRHDGRHSTCGAAAETARQRQTFANAQRDATTFTDGVNNAHAAMPAVFFGRVSAAAGLVAGDVVDAHQGRSVDQPRGHFVARRPQREAEGRRSAGDIRDGRRSEAVTERIGTILHVDGFEPVRQSTTCC
jgi:hypothetical protein